MNPLLCIMQILSGAPAPTEADDTHPPISQTFFFIVLPLSFLPPGMLLLAGYFHPAAFFVEVPYARWVDVAAAFFVTELLTVPLMAAVIRDLAKMLALRHSFRQAFLVAGIAPIPLWLSSLALAVPHPAVLVLGVGAGLVLSALLLHRGVRKVFRITDEEDAQALSSSAFSVGGLAWAILCGIVILPLLG